MTVATDSSLRVDLTLSGQLSLDVELGDFGRDVPPRTQGRNAAHREDYSLRRLLFAWSRLDLLGTPLSIHPAATGEFPDFRLDWRDGSERRLGIEVTEAGPEHAQAWMTETERSLNQTEILHNGPYVPKAQSKLVADAILTAIDCKAKKYQTKGIGYPIDLLVYENFFSDMAHLDRVFGHIHEATSPGGSSCGPFAHVHLVVGSLVVIDLFGQPRFVDLSNDYSTDFVAWSAVQARLLRDGRLSEIDASHIAEEIESLGKSDCRALRQQVKLLLAHLLKWRHQPERRDASWATIISDTRFELQGIADDSPSLAAQIPALVALIYPKAAKEAAGEMGIDVGALPVTCTFTYEQIRDNDFMPE
jgi:Domain of unknown function DUF29